MAKTFLWTDSTYAEEHSACWWESSGRVGRYVQCFLREVRGVGRKNDKQWKRDSSSWGCSVPTKRAEAAHSGGLTGARWALWLVGTSDRGAKAQTHKHSLTHRTNELLCVCADTQTLRCRRGKMHAFEKFVAKTVKAFNVEELVKHAAWQGEGRSAMQSDWKVQTELEVKYSRARLNVCLSFCIVLFLLQLNTKMPFKIPIYPIHLNWFFSFLVDEEFSVRNSHKTAKKVKCVYCYCMSTTSTIPNSIM